jgi:hypothetical protein
MPLAMNKLYQLFLHLFLFASLNTFSQSSSSSAINIVAAAWNGSAPTTTNYCLTASPQTANACGGAATDVYWFRFTVPTSVTTASVKVSVAPVGFDAVIDFYAGTAAAPIYRECSNTAGNGATEVLKTTFATNPIVTGTEYYFRVSSLTDVAALCFNLSLEYYPTSFVRTGHFPNPQIDDAVTGYKVTQVVPRQPPVPAGVPTLVTGTRFRFVDIALPANNPGCTFTINNSSFSEVTLRNVPCVCYGTSYRVFVELQVDNHWCGEGEMRMVNLEPEPNTTITTPPCAALTFAGQVQALFIANSAIFEWEFSQAGTVLATVSTPPGQTFVNLSQVPCLRFNRVYSVRIRVSYCGTFGAWSPYSCVITQPFPTVNITSSACGSTVPSFFTINSAFVPGVNQTIFRLYRINPGAPTFPIAPAVVLVTNSNFMNLGPYGLAPGGTYVIQARGRRTSCGIVQEGDFGPLCIFTVAGGGAIMLDESEIPENLEDYEAVDIIETEDLDFDFTSNDSGTLAVFTLSNQQRILTFNTEAFASTGSATLQLFNTSGQLVHTGNVTLSEGIPVQQTELPNTISSGIYIVRLHNADGVISDKIALP